MKRLLPLLPLAPVVFACADLSAQISDDPSIVEAGRTLFEFDHTFTHDRYAGGRTDWVNIGSLLITRGINSRTDVGVGFDGYYRDRTRLGGATTTTHDWGDLTLRAKYSLRGHDREETRPGDTALAVLPYVKLPLKLGDAGSDLCEGGLIVPFSVALSGDWLLGVMTEFDFVADAADRHRRPQWIESVVLSRNFGERTSGYVEFYSVLPHRDVYDWTAQLNVGFYCAFGADLWLDAGCNFGLNNAAPDLQPFVGLSYLY